MTDCVQGVQDETDHPPSTELLHSLVFSNDVFWRQLEEHLNFGDLKVCRLVSRGFNEKVLQSTRFKRRSEIALNPHRLQGSIFGTTKETWKNIRFTSYPCLGMNPYLNSVEGSEGGGNDGDERKKEEEDGISGVSGDWFYTRLSEVEGLYVDAHELGNMYLLNLNQVLESAKQLKRLSINQLLLHRQTEPPSAERTEETLRHLEELELLGFNDLTVPTATGLEWIHHFARMIKSLRVLRTGESVSDNVLRSDSYLPPADQLYTRLIFDLLETSRSTLQSLQLHEAGLWFCFRGGNEILVEKRFPVLNAVRICMKEAKALKIVEFLRRHPLLEEIDLTVYNRFPVEVLEFIEERKCHLKRLCIRTGAFEVHEDSLWTFLRSLDNLETFSLEWLHSFVIFPVNYNISNAILSNLPAGVKRIRLEGIPAHGTGPNVKPESFSRLNPFLLTELCLSSCGGIGDPGMKYICKNFLRLRVLKILKASEELTSVGSSPNSEDQYEDVYSISDLVGLRSLTLSQCDGITGEALVQGIKFKELRFLDISSNKRISGESVRKILAQNPRLEVLWTSAGPFCEGIEGLREICPRLNDLVRVCNFTPPANQKCSMWHVLGLARSYSL